MPHIPISRLGRRRLLAVALAVAGCATMPIAAASADSRSTTGLQVDCWLGDHFVPPGTTYTFPPGDDGSAGFTVVCGDDGLWHRQATVIQPPPLPIAPVPVPPPTQGG
jgi:hypothetical protein